LTFLFSSPAHNYCKHFVSLGDFACRFALGASAFVLPQLLFVLLLSYLALDLAELNKCYQKLWIPAEESHDQVC